MGGVVGVAIDAPAERAVAQADTAQLVYCLGEDRVGLDGDAVLDGDADGALVGVGLSFVDTD